MGDICCGSHRHVSVTSESFERDETGCPECLCCSQRNGYLAPHGRIRILRHRLEQIVPRCGYCRACGAASNRDLGVSRQCLEPDWIGNVRTVTPEVCDGDSDVG